MLIVTPRVLPAAILGLGHVGLIVSIIRVEADRRSNRPRSCE